ncbi:MAG: FMN-binding protein [Myxococcales bacterium]|nr:FMN-binding protein [Myxococcales bacterium]MDD9970978.1 FMN-binding protein [Myxococcales bacterium]
MHGAANVGERGDLAPGHASSLRLVATLALAGFFSGVVLCGVYLASAPRIASNRAAALERAVLEVVPGAVAFSLMVAGADGRLTPADSSERIADVDPQVPEPARVYATRDARGERVGYAIEAQGPGFMDTIRLLYGLDPATGTVIGLRILASRETPGLGDKIMYDPAFVESFRALSVEPEIVAVTRRPRRRSNEVDCIGGATISSRAVVQIVAGSSARWLPLLAGRSRDGTE